MRLIVLLVVLVLRRLDLSWPEWMKNHRGERLFMSPLVSFSSAESGAWLLRVMLPGVAVFGVLYILSQLIWGLPALLAGGVLVIWLLGTGSEFRSLDELVVRGRLNDAEELESAAREHFGHTASITDEGYFVGLCRAIGQREAGYLFAAIFYLVTLGYAALTIYILNRWLAERRDSGSSWARTCDDAFTWLPSRLLIITLALAADFRRVMTAVDGRIWQQPDSSQDGDEVLSDALTAALDITDEDEQANIQEGVEILEELQSLLLRVLSIWLMFSAAWVLLIG
jgi:AmpE protein|tara:strand:- start:51867 stop:52715 length:849 start_codon:yes stop_codon:yes gene_type:complete